MKIRETSNLELNEILPWDTIVRHPEEQNIDDVPFDYYANMVDLHRFLAETLVQDSFMKTLSKPEGFRDWILACHKLVCEGFGGNRQYSGQSKHEEGPTCYEMRGEWRGPKDFIKLHMCDDVMTRILDVAMFYDDEFARGLDDKLEWIVKYRATGIIQVIHTSGIEGPKMEIVPKAFSTSVEEIKRYMLDVAQNVLIYIKGDEHWRFYYPGPKYISQFLEVMRKNLQYTLRSMQENSINEALTFLASYYQAGVRSQALRGVWNSLLMAQVNLLITLMGFNRVPHRQHDTIAMILEEETNQRYFRDFVTGDIHVEYKFPPQIFEVKKTLVSKK